MAPGTRKPTSKSAATTTSQQTAPSSRAWEALTPALSDWILDAVSSMGFHRMTPVQASTIPLFTGSKDVVVEAVTGSGKTLAFLIPVVQRLLRLEEPVRRHHVGAIVISPTRELATQIHAVLLSLLAFHAPSASTLQPAETTPTFGGPNDFYQKPPPFTTTITTPQQPTTTTPHPSSTLKITPQLLLGGTTTPAQDLSHFLTHSPNLLIATPGRLLELLSSPHVHCPQSSFEVLVLDEADRLLDLGFKEDLQRILQRLPKQRRTGLFSASISEAVDQLVRVGLRNPVKIAVKVKGASGEDDQRTPASLQLTYLTTPPTHKLPALLSLLHNLHPTPPQKSIVYLSTCAAVDYFSHLLPHLITLLHPTSNLLCVPLHGKHTPAVRRKNFTRFVSTATPTLLITTDLAARGLDIPAVDLTVQLDPPSDPKTFLHRAGRAGRAGRKGLAVVFLLPGRETDEYPSFLAIRKTPVSPLAPGPLPLPFPSTTTTTTTAEAQAEANSLTWTTSEEAIRTISHLRTHIQRDRALHDKAQRAFVSWVRAYSKHAASSIFRVADLDWEAHGHAWALLKLPRMPELKGRGAAKASGVGDEGAGDDETRGEPLAAAKADRNRKSIQSPKTPAVLDTTLGLTIPWQTYPYLDSAREKKRQQDLLFPPTASNPKDTRPRRSTAWSTQQAAKDTAAARREKKARKREAERVGGLGPEERKREAELGLLVEKVREGVLRGKEEEEWMGFD